MNTCERAEVLDIKPCALKSGELDAQGNPALEIALPSGNSACTVCIGGLYERSKKRVNTDKLTGLASNWKIQDDLERMNAFARRGIIQGVGMVQFDVEAFKEVNDREGQAAGDRMIIVVARSIGGRAVDTVARLGGDEFGILTPVPLLDQDGKRVDPDLHLNTIANHGIDTFESAEELIAFNERHGLAGGPREVGLRAKTSYVAAPDYRDFVWHQTQSNPKPIG